jgi:hypothetical protein
MQLYSLESEIGRLTLHILRLTTDVSDASLSDPTTELAVAFQFEKSD